MPVFNNILAGAAGSGGVADYTIKRSLRFDEDSTSHLTRTPSSAGNRRTWTWSGWIKTTTSSTYRALIEGYGGTPAGANRTSFQLNNQGKLHILFDNGNSGQLLTSRQFRDPSSWFHVVLAVDTSQSTEANRVKIYVNGELLESSDYDTTVYPSRNYSTGINNNQPHYINRVVDPKWGDWYAAEVYLVDGQQLAATDFGEVDADTGVWNPISPTFTSPNDGTVWSSFLSSAAGFNRAATTAFDGDIFSTANTPSNTGGYYTGETNAFEFIPSSSIPFTSSVKVTGRGTGQTTAKAKIDTGSGYGSEINLSGDGIETVISGSGNLVKLKVWTVTYAGENELGAILIDDVPLVDGVDQYGTNGFQLPFSPDTSLTHPNKYATQGNSATPPSDATSLTYSTGNYLATNEGVTYDAGSVRKFWVQPGSADPGVKTSNNGTTWTTVFDGSVTWNDPIEVNCRYVYMSSSGSNFGIYYDQEAVAADASGADNHWLPKNLVSSEILSTVAQTVTITGNTTTSGRGPYSKTAPKPVAGKAITDPEYSSSLQSGNTSGDAVTVTFNPAFTGVIYAGNSGGGVCSINGGTEFTPQSNVSYALNPIAVTNCTSFYSKTTVSGQRGWISVAFRDDGTQVYNSSDVFVDVDDTLDSPTNYAADSGNNGGNYAVWNALDKGTSTVLSEGNLKFRGGVSSAHRGVRSTIMPTSKMYAEMTLHAAQTGFGLANASADLDTHTLATGKWAFYSGEIRSNGTGLASVTAASVGDIIQIAYDPANNKAWIGLNNTWYSSSGATTGNPSTGANATFTINDDVFVMAHSYNDSALTVNFGANPFVYTPPTGFKSLCTQNLDDPLIADPSTAFQANVWTGNQSARSITTTGMSPDLVWIKGRSHATWHELFDTTRGPLKQLYSNEPNQEATTASTLTDFNTDGFSLGSNNGVNGANTRTYVGWAWEGGDLATNSTYNQDRTWSDGVTMSGTVLVPATSAFDGNANTSACPYDTAGGGGANPWIQVTFNPGIPYTSSVKVERQNGNPTGYTVSMNGGTGVNSAFQAYTTVATGSGTLTSIRVTNNGSTNTAGISRIEVDGKVLVDKGVIPVGSLNSSVYDQSDTWTDDFSGPSGSLNYVSNMFDGTLNNEVYASTHPATITWTPSGGLAYTSMRINARTQANHSNGVKYKLVGGSEVSIGTSTTQTWYTLPANSTLEYVKIERPSGSNAAGLVAAVEKDGKILVNDTTTPANVPTIASTVRANPTAGFSIVKYTSTNTNNATVGHGLNAAPEFILIKNIDSSEFWWAIHKYMNNDPWNDSTLRLNSSDGTTGVYGTFNNVAPTSSVVNLSNTTTPAPNKGTDDKIMYSFAPVKGYSAFGSYESSTPFVYTGFRPAYVIIKSTSGGRNWIVLDSARDQFNRTDRALLANDPSIEDDNSTYSVDFLSNGFKVLGSNGQITGDSRYIYLAFAENPFKYARAR